MQKAGDIELERRLSAPTGRRIAPIKVGGETLWLKDFDQPTAAKWDRVQRGAFFVTRLQVLRPVPSLSGLEGAEKEIEAIRRFREIGVRVPEIVWVRGAKVALSDLGETLREIERRGGEAGISSAVVSAAGELSRLHAHGIVHGRPILRNLTWDGATVGFLDFEERPLEVMPPDAAKAEEIFFS